MVDHGGEWAPVQYQLLCYEFDMRHRSIAVNRDGDCRMMPRERSLVTSTSTGGGCKNARITRMKAITRNSPRMEYGYYN